MGRSGAVRKWAWEGTKASSYRGGFELTLAYRDLWNKTNIEASKVKCPVIW